MSFFGLSTKKEVEERERQAREAAKSAVLQGQQTDLTNLAKGSQFNFSIPYFDVFDPRFENYAVPISVHGVVVYGVDDITRFNSINKSQNVNNSVFQEKLKGNVVEYIKGVVANAPADNGIPVLQLEQKIIELSALVLRLVSPRVEQTFGINVRTIDITEIIVKKNSVGYRELKSVTTDLEGNKIRTMSALNLDAMKRQQEMNLGGQEELQRMQLENQRETMRIQREEMQRAARLQTETNFLSAHQANLNAGGGMFAGYQSAPQMPSMPQMPTMTPQVQYMVNVNNQPMGPCDWNQLQQLVQQGQLIPQTPVWKQGMSQWQCAGEVQELCALFA